MLSLIGSSATPAALTAHFRRFANALTDDRQEFILRFADTRVLTGLPGALSKPHWDGLSAPIAQWVVLDREGCPQRLPIAPDRQLLSGDFELWTAELTALVAQGEWGRPIATRIYAKARPGYHPVTSGTVDKLLAAK